MQRNHIRPEQFALMKKNLKEVMQITEASVELSDISKMMRMDRVSRLQARGSADRMVDRWKDEYIGYKG